MKLELERDEVELILRSLLMTSTLYPNDTETRRDKAAEVTRFLYKVLNDDIQTENKELY